MADYSSSGVWAICLPGERDPFRHQMITHETLGSPPELTLRFDKWVAHCSQWFDWKYGHGPLGLSAEELDAQGRLLAHALKQHVGRNCLVVYAPLADRRADEAIG
jgi:hypothetical protein